MAHVDDISEDRGFKALFAGYPQETIAVLAPEVLAAYGQPRSVVALQQESLRPDLAEPARFADIALLATWEDGLQAVIVLIEHWSTARRVDLRRVHWYVADLGLQHPAAMVLPIILVTEPGEAAVPELLEHRIAGRTTVLLRVQVVRITSGEAVRLRSLHNRVAAVLSVLAVADAVEGAIQALAAMSRAPGPRDDIERFLPFVLKLARMTNSDEQRFRQRLTEEQDMGNIITEMKAEARQEGRQEGRIEMQRDSLRKRIQAGVLTVDAARAEVDFLGSAQVITADEARQLLSELG
jgi:hypothetical protein